jgi:hypothetical protein
MIDPILIPIAGLALPMILVPVILGIRYARLERELEHAERMKALELGRTLSKDEGWWTLPRISVAIGAGVPTAVFFCAWQASESQPDSKDIWLGAAIVGLGAVLSGSVLAARHFLPRERAADPVYGVPTKSQSDPYEYDVVSRRG